MTKSNSHHHHHHQGSRLGNLLRKYRFEIIWLGVVGLGLFLILERMSIRATVFRWLRTGIGDLFHGLSHLDATMSSLVSRITFSDVLGYLLILAAIVVAILRLRWRLKRSASATAIRCPRCEGEIHRVHRHALDRLISWFVPVRRYRCSNRECRWEGIRVVAAGQQQRQAPAPR